MLTIDKNIPMTGRIRKGRGKYPFAIMQPGDSVYIPEHDYGAIAAFAKARARWSGHLTKRANGGLRIWRVS